MAITKISEWSATAGSNTEIDGVPLGEGIMVPSNVNNALRELMSQVAEMFSGASGDKWPVTAGGTGSSSAAGARTNLGLGTAATKDTGTSAGQVVVLEALGKLPAVDGSQLTGISGGTATITAGENLADRDLIYQDVFNQRSAGPTRWYKVDSDATAPVKISPRLGIALAAITSGNTGSAQVRQGLVSGFTGLTAGQACWASTTAGIVTQTEPAVPSSGTQNAVRLIGYAASTTEIDFDPDPVTTFAARNSAVTATATLSVQHFTDSGARERIPHAYIATDTFANTASVTLDADLSGYNTYAIRQVVPAAAISTSGTSIKITLQSASSEGLTFTTCRIQEKASSGNAWDFASAGVTVLFSGVDGGSVPTNSTLTSDATTFALDETKDYVISYYISAVADSMRKKTTQSGWTAYFKIGTSADASGTTPSGFSDSGEDVLGVAAILVNTSTRAEPVIIGSETVNSAATDMVTFQFSDTSSANQDTYTTATNRTGATRDLVIEVTL